MTADPLVLLLMLGSAAAGAAVGRLCRFPMWALTGAIAGTAAAHLSLNLSVEMPAGLTMTAQILVGTTVGARADLSMFVRARSLLLPGAVTVVTIVVAGVGVGLALATTGAVEHVTAALGTIPGGGGEMVAAAESLEAESSVVAVMHVVRVFVVLSLLPLMIGWATRRYGEGPGVEADS